MKSDEFFLPTIADGEDKSSPLCNRIRKNYRHIRKWAKRTHTNCFRLYNKEIHQYPLAIDFYDGKFCIYYFSKSRLEEDPPQDLIEVAEKALLTIFNAHSNTIVWKTRAKRKETRQYEKKDNLQDYFTVLEYGVKFKINLVDYLDTGLFLDHRETRQLVAANAKGKRVLNLFAYTCSFSVQAAAAGAIFTKSVDMSNTYTAWGKDNFLLNKFSLKDNEIIRADCLKFLDEEISHKGCYDLIIIDPPTISRSKKMDQLFDIQVDYIALIKKSLRLLTLNGKIYFSTNSRKFLFDEALFPQHQIKELTHKTIPIDFQDDKIHRCWEIS